MNRGNGIVSAKRTKAERSGLHGWHPYYAGYSEKFVASAIKYLKLTERSVVLDPWVGSGTTNLICEKFGVPSVGIDINPAMVNFASGKQSYLIAVDFLTPLLKEIRSSRISIVQDTVPSGLSEFFSSKSAVLFVGLLSLLQSIEIDQSPLCLPLQALNPSIERINPVRAFLLSGLFITARTMSGHSRASNPTWYRVDTENPDYSESDIKSTYIRILQKMYDDIRQTHGFGRQDCLYLNQCASALDLPYEADTFDAVITSPPYLTRIDYAVSTKLELLLLAGDHRFRELRVQSMGAPTIRKDSHPVDDQWGVVATRLMKLISEHPSKASKTYYVKNFAQYFSDAYKSLCEIQRVMNKGGTALVVVQSSYYKEHEIPLGEIYVEIGLKLGFDSKIVFREEVKGHMAHVNTKSSIYKKNKVYFEDVVSLTK